MTESKTSYVTAVDTLLKTPLPEETRTYKPVSHAELIELTLKSIDGAGFKLDSERYSTAKDGQVANGRYTISNVMDSEMMLEIGWQNSYDKSLSLKFAIGTRILVCANGCVSGDYGAFRKKHRGDIQEFTPLAITEYIKSAADVFSLMQIEREKMKNIELNVRTRAELIGRMFIEDEIIQSTQLNIIKRQIEAPSHDYGAPGSLWELYQHTTYAMKEVHPSLWMKNHIDAHNFFTKETHWETFIPTEHELGKISTPVSPELAC